MVLLPILIMLLGTAAVFFMLYARTDKLHNRRLAVMLVKWTAIAAAASLVVWGIGFVL